MNRTEYNEKLKRLKNYSCPDVAKHHHIPHFDELMKLHLLYKLDQEELGEAFDVEASNATIHKYVLKNLF